MRKKNAKNRKRTAAIRSTAGFGTDDPRMMFLRDGPTDKLTFLLGEIFNRGPAISPMYFSIGMDSRFRKTQPLELFDMVVAVLRERVPNEALSGGATKL